MNKKKLIIVAGPTAAGKTDAAINLAKKYNGEIISADSMQVYKYMDIGSAKVTVEEMQGVPHHLIDVLDPRDEFNVAVFQKLAKEALEGIYERGHLPIIAGGTGFYIQALLYDIDFTENGDDRSYRHEMEGIASGENGPHILHEMLRKVDPKAAQEIHENNVKRVIRALEFFHETGTRISEHNETERQKVSPYDYKYFVLYRDRELLYKRIEMRVDKMMEAGLLQEVIRLRDMGLTKDMVSMKGLGYKELLSYLDGECSLEEAVALVKLETRHFAKRQLTWFRREKDVIWVNADKENLIDVYENGLK